MTKRIVEKRVCNRDIKLECNYFTKTSPLLLKIESDFEIFFFVIASILIISIVECALGLLKVRSCYD